MAVYSGIDLHSNNSVVSVKDGLGKLLYRKRLPNKLEEVLGALEPLRDELVSVAVESTYNWYWLVDGLKAAAYEVRLANPAGMKRYDGLKHANDDTDADFLADLLRLNILPTGYIYPPEERALRDLGRRRLQLVRQRTMNVLALQNVRARETGARMAAYEAKRLEEADIDALGLLPDVALGMKANAAVIEVLNEQIAALERHILEKLAPRPEHKLLETIPGIGRVLGPLILLETGPIGRFAGVGNYASYARAVQSVHSSNGKKKGEGNRRNGNKYLAWAFIEAAHCCTQRCPEAKRFYERKRAQKNAVVATKALAQKLARATYHMLKNGEPFDVKRCFS